LLLEHSQKLKLSWTGLKSPLFQLNEVEDLEKQEVSQVEVARDVAVVAFP
jgi:hypothetical protein